MKFEISGKIRLGSEKRPFKKEIEASTEKYAIEKLYCLFGSDNRLPRQKVSIEHVKKVE
ncbi:50S ribosomal protein L18a [Candidatus Micrarchaeota archaeon]|nr:50S ribosomal protein L18a [Candidatus Micrarchaeota archaeon]